VKEAINEVGKEHKYAYVLNTDANAYPYISGNGEAENCTDAVLTRLGIK
jgi:Skp family chaperone for outer membrane proteins